MAIGGGTLAVQVRQPPDLLCLRFSVTLARSNFRRLVLQLDQRKGMIAAFLCLTTIQKVLDL